MKPLFKKLFLLGFLLVIMFQLSGCGETISGVGKDLRRVGKGVKTIFVRD